MNIEYDPMALVKEDDHAINESRWVLIGLSCYANILTVVYTLREEDTIRLISARKATRKEASYYA
ncbi:MAG: BrnT family toxin [bacterium]